MARREPVTRSGADVKRRAGELVLKAASELRVGRFPGRTPRLIRAWEREYRRYHARGPEARGRWHRLRTDLRDVRIGTLPAPDHRSLTLHEALVAPRLYQEKVGYNYDGTLTPTWRTVGYRWDVEDRGGYGAGHRTWFTLTVNAAGEAEFRAPSHRNAGDEDAAFPADPDGWRGLVSHVSDSIARLDPLRPRKPVRLWRYPYHRDGVDMGWEDVHRSAYERPGTPD
ncbi:hypothetical protein O7599_32575 [Streptomyces sp. WMMC500]|uniref:hypothetical protein n=1 Tax=Streptomyces sp. WMMC500 TaxID=3015154 RepID=UPI00248AE8A8|nr:hypothetical protein [Streptomyces sp. WMMC500]WBB60209.1 hypothetical protein O7599_32575 [Streptomyces sp. WMMC500]